MRCGSSSPRLQSPASGQRKAHRERPGRPLLNNNSPFFPARARTLRDRGAYAPPHLTTSHHRQHTQANSKHHANQTHAAATCAAPSLQPPHGVKKRRAAGAAYANPYRRAKQPPSRATEAGRRERNADSPNYTRREPGAGHRRREPAAAPHPHRPRPTHRGTKRRPNLNIDKIIIVCIYKQTLYVLLHITF